MWQYNYTPNPNELYHFGILGMKWGHRRWQNKDGSLTPAGYIHYYGHPRPKNETGPVYAPNDKRSASKSNIRSKSKNIHTTSNKTSNTEREKTKNSNSKESSLSEKQKTALKIGAAAAATALVAIGGYAAFNSYTGRKMLIDSVTGFKKIGKEMTDLDNLQAINPGRTAGLFRKKGLKTIEIIDGSSTNCMLCTTAYDLRKRGFDVRAGKDLGHNGFMPDDLFPKIYKNYKGTNDVNLFNGDSDKINNAFFDILRKNGLNKFNTDDRSKAFKILLNDKYQNVLSEINKNPPGSRGNIMVWWNGGGGHSMIWERDASGVVKFMDGQTNTVYNNFFDDVFANTSALKPTHILRTDNLEIDPKGMKDFINTDTLFKTYVDNGTEIVKNLYVQDPVARLTIQSAVAAPIIIGLDKKFNQNKKIEKENK